jgi:competence protein ComEA
MQNGEFKSIEDIMEVSGIGQAKFDAIKNMITI